MTEATGSVQFCQSGERCSDSENRKRKDHLDEAENCDTGFDNDGAVGGNHVHFFLYKYICSIFAGSDHSTAAGGVFDSLTAGAKAGSVDNPCVAVAWRGRFAGIFRWQRRDRCDCRTDRWICPCISSGGTASFLSGSKAVSTSESAAVPCGSRASHLIWHRTAVDAGCQRNRMEECFFYKRPAVFAGRYHKGGGGSILWAGIATLYKVAQNIKYKWGIGDMEDLLILVDTYDRQIGTMGKMEAHRKGRLHRAFSIFIIQDGKMLIQKRRQDKYHSGGLWANACCSHPRNGEELEQAVHRRLQEEVGFDCPLQELFHFTYRSKYAEELFEYEIDHVFIGSYDGEVALNPEEVEEIRWISFDALARELLEQPDQYSTWFQIAAPKVLEHLATEE